MKKILLTLTILFIPAYIFTGPTKSPRFSPPSKFSSDAVVGKNNCDLTQLTALFGSLKKQIKNFQKITCDKFQDTWTILDEIGKFGCTKVIFQDDIPFVIDEPGLYCLGEDVSFNAGIAIDIQSSFVVLDLASHQINGLAAGETCVHLKNVFGVVVKSGLLESAQGVFIENCSGAKFEEILFLVNRDWALKGTNSRSLIIKKNIIGGAIDTGFAFDQCNNIVLKDIELGATGTGIFALDTNNIFMENNLVINCGFSGILFDGVKKGFIIDSKTNNCAENGFIFKATNTIVDTFILRGCLANGNGKSGFAVKDIGNVVENLEFEACQSSSNHEHGFEITGTNHIIRDCTALDNDFSGINVDGFGIQLLNNAMNGNQGDGIFLSLSAFNAQVINNAVNQSGGIGINNASGLGGNYNRIFNNFSSHSAVADFFGVAAVTLQGDPAVAGQNVCCF